MMRNGFRIRGESLRFPFGCACASRRRLSFDPKKKPTIGRTHRLGGSVALLAVPRVYRRDCDEFLVEKSSNRANVSSEPDYGDGLSARTIQAFGAPITRNRPIGEALAGTPQLRFLEPIAFHKCGRERFRKVDGIVEGPPFARIAPQVHAPLERTAWLEVVTARDDPPMRVDPIDV